ncbi:MAG: hypothetical protein PUB49_01105 [Selenomonadaceae bacterium]|nr:hypothetical protein [Selenomonadaceae bacterium]
MNNYQLLRDAYFGTGGFANGAYLTKHKRESDDDYRFRCENAYYLNYFAPIVNALVDPIFKKMPLRDYKSAMDGVIADFLQDVDGNGTDMDTFIKRAAVMAKVYGVSFIVVDNFKDMNARTMAEVQRFRQYPYLYVVGPEDVQEYGIDRNGQLTFIEFREQESQDNGAITYRYTRFTRDGWSISGGSSGVKSAGQYNFGRVPVVPLFSRLLEQKTMRPSSDMMPIAKTAKALYNHCSWLGEILRNQTFPLLTIPSFDVTELTIGNNNALGYNPNSTHEPDFIAPPSDPAKTLQEQCGMLVQEMYRMANLSFIMGMTNQNTSGVARQWEFERTNQQLANFAVQCGRAEEAIMDLFAQWLNTDIGYSVTYPDDFGVVDVGAQIEMAQAVLDLGLTSELKTEVLKRVMGAYCPDISDERYDEIVAAQDNEQNDADYGTMPQDGNEEETHDKE